MSSIPENDRRFCEELHVHKDALRGWLHGKFPGLTDLDNIVQETLIRVWRSLATAHVASPRALLFTTAHNLAIDELRRQNVVSISTLTETQELYVDEGSPSPAEAAAKKQELEYLIQAIQSLPDRCRQVLTLRKIYGLSQKDIARQLGISEHTVEAQVGIGMRRCAEFLARLGLP
jgi:RNA polymerase sigma factor (sigma-70 family)